MKKCFKCEQVKPITEFYKHPKMADGHLGKCKECTKLDTMKDYHENREKHAEYEKKRFKTPERKEKIKIYAARMKAKNPEKTKARRDLRNAVRDRRVIPQPCQKCGELKVQGHHADYSKPLDVAWLCFRCHRAEHGQQVMNTTHCVVTAKPQNDN